jgi:crotonobetainyl-CoA:carnitine CoA-transferase CaiB-like acyl-CoA transferase
MAGPARQSGARPLDGVRVVDFGQYLAGPLVCALLAEHGADVVHVDPPGGPRRPALAAALRTRPADRLVLDLTSATERAQARSLIGSADVVVENFRPGVLTHFGLGAAISDSHPRLVYCSLPGFGADDERSAMPGWEGVVMAAGGAYSTDVPTGLIPDDAGHEGPVAFSPLPLASMFAALHGAIAIVAALLARDRDGWGQVIEVPLADALADAVGVRSTSYEHSPPRNSDFGHGLFRCSDGQYINLVLVQHRHLEWCSAAFAPQLQAHGLLDLDRLRSDPRAGAAVREILVQTFATRPAAHWESIGQRAGLAIGRVRSLAEWTSGPGRRVDLSCASGSGQDLGLGNGIGAATSALLLEEHPATGQRGVYPLSRAADSAAPALSGYRVLDMSRVIAGPTVGRVLAQYGADVLAIDTDPAGRATAVDEPVWHEFLNRGKRSAIMDLTTVDGQRGFQALLGEAHVVVQNSSPASLKKLAVDASALLARVPGLTVVSLTAFDARGPWADFRGYAETANSVTGISSRTLPPTVRSGTLPTVDRPRWTFTDTAAGLLGALGAVLGLTQSARRGSGTLARVSLAGTAVLAQLPYLVESTIDNCEARSAVTSDAASVGWSAWHRVYTCADGSAFVAVGLAAREAVVRALGADQFDRGAAATLNRLLGPLTVAEAVERIRSAGGAASPIVTLAELSGPGGTLAQRRLWLEDTTERHGRISMVGPVGRLHGTPLLPGAIPAAFGSAAASFAVRTRGSSRPQAGRRPDKHERA